MTSRPDLQRRYEKGERRFKHVGNTTVATIAFDNRDPKKWVGKCPRSVSEADRNRLLRQAVAASNGDRELAAPKRLYVVHHGAIYEAQTSDGGTTYHGYPYRGRLSRELLAALEQMAQGNGHADEFRDWVRKHIVRHGENK